jgi:ankyrin repeat protein
LKQKGQLNISDNYGNQPLWTAVFNVKGKDDRLPLVELFLMYNADKNHKNKAGKSPLDFTLQVKYEPCYL